MRRSTSAPSRPWVTAVLWLLIPLTAAADGPAAVSVNVRPKVLFAGGDVRTTVHTPRDDRNRELRIVVEGADYYASSDVQLDGVDAAATHQFTWKTLPGGLYRVDAILVRADGETRTVSNCFAVLTGDDGEAVPPSARARQAPQGDSISRSGC